MLKIVRSGITPFISVIKKPALQTQIRLISPVFEHICLKLGEKASQHALLHLAFDGFTLRDAADLVLNAADLVLNATVWSQITDLSSNRVARSMVCRRFYFRHNTVGHTHLCAWEWLKFVLRLTSTPA